MKSRLELATSQLLFAPSLLALGLILLNGYTLNVLGGLRANPWIVLAGSALGLALTFGIARVYITVHWDWLEAFGFVGVVVGVWGYFIAPALPTLLPPTQSSDAVRVYLQIMHTYPNGTLVSWYPAGGTFVTAMLAHWLGIAPLYLMHPVGALMLALSAGAVYGMTCAVLPPTRRAKLAALIAPALLFAPWSYFAGALNWEQYFFAQVFAQYFTLAALWFTASYAARAHGILAALIGAALLGVVAAYPIFVALPLGVFALVVLAPSVRARAARRGAILALIGFVVLLALAALVLQLGGILEIITAQKSLTGDVGAGGVATPSLETLGGPIFLALALAGVIVAWRANAFGKTILGFVLVWSLQLAALLVTQPFLQISGYRVDKTFYILVFPLAMLAALLPAQAFARVTARIETSRRALLAASVALGIVLSASIGGLRPPKAYQPFTPAELDTALWAKQNLDTYQIAYLDPLPSRAYWLAFGLWRETLPNEWFQWIPAGVKLGPADFDAWLADPRGHPYALVRQADLGARQFEALPVNLVYRAGDCAIVQRRTAPLATAKPAHALSLYYESTLHLLGYDLPRTTFEPGETITFTTHTEAVYPPPATIYWRAQLADRAGKIISQVERDPFGNRYPVQRWFPGAVANDAWALPMPAQLAPGAYQLQLGLYRRTDGMFVDVHPLFSEKALQEHYAAAPLTQIKIPLPPPSAAELRAARISEQRFGETMTLLRYALTTERATRRVQLTLYWQAFGIAPTDYTVFVHLLDAGGNIVAQHDAQPRGGAYPTSVWDIGEIVRDDYALVAPPDAIAPFTLAIGMYAQPGLKRLPVGNGDHLKLNVEF